MNVRHDIEKYISEINDIYNSGVQTEHTFRVPLVNLLTQLLSGNKKRNTSDKKGIANHKHELELASAKQIPDV